MKKKPKIKYTISQRTEPTCRKRDCDIRENPEHWVDVQLEEPYKSAEDLAVALDRTLDRLKYYSDGENEFSGEDHQNKAVIEEAKAILKKAGES